MSYNSFLTQRVKGQWHKVELNMKKNVDNLQRFY